MLWVRLPSLPHAIISGWEILLPAPLLSGIASRSYQPAALQDAPLLQTSFLPRLPRRSHIRPLRFLITVLRNCPPSTLKSSRVFFLDAWICRSQPERHWRKELPSRFRRNRHWNPLQARASRPSSKSLLVSYATSPECGKGLLRLRLGSRDQPNRLQHHLYL